MRRPLIIVLAVVLVLAVASGSFYGGMAYERTRQANLQARFFAERGFAPGEGFPGGFPMATPRESAGGSAGAPESGFGRGTNGTIKSLEGDSLLLSTPEDVTTVVLNSDTVILHTVAGDRALLQPGLRVVVSGERDESGAIHAATIQVLAGEQP